MVLDQPLERQAAGVSIANSLAKAGIDFAVGLPDDWLQHTISAVQNDEKIQYVPMVNERSGVCICAGAWLGGKRPVILMEASGLLMAVEALTRLRPFHLPFLIILSYRGDFGDGNSFAAPQGDVVRPVLDALRIRHEVVSELRFVEKAVSGAVGLAEAAKQPTALLLRKSVVHP